MLKSLAIRDFAIIEQLHIDFDNGMSVVTGETGAGKSIIMGALAIVMGGKMEGRSLREGASKCVIEATFQIEDLGLKPLFESLDMDYDDETILRRELSASGKSRAFVNDSPVSLGDLRTLGEQLIDIHSQHANLLVKNRGWQLHTLDTLADTTSSLLPTYQQQFKSWKTTAKQLAELEEARRKGLENKDWVLYQLEELTKANLKEGEQATLEQRQHVLSHAEELQEELSFSSAQLNNEGNSITDRVREVAEHLHKASNYDKSLEPLADRMQSCYIELKDIASEVDGKQGDTDYNPAELEQVNERLDTIYSLEKKHGVDNETALLQKQAEWQDLLNASEDSDERIQKLKAQLKEQEAQATQTAQQLSKARKDATTSVQNQVIAMLKDLGMKEVRMQIDITPTELSESGMDNVEILFSANAKSSPQPIGNIASGGEIARVMLSLKALLAQKAQLPTIVFDEIDTGISGEVADKMGTIMRAMSSHMQVICITHLPQIAARGEHHYRVHKQDSSTAIDLLTPADRIREIAQMLSGSNITEAALANAQELLHL